MKKTYREKASDALEKMYARYWTEEEGGHILPTHCGRIVEKPIMIWEIAMLLIAMELYYEATHDQKTADRIASTWSYLKTCFTPEQMCGNFGHAPNLALDDAGWDIMTYFMAYRFTGDQKCLNLTRDAILGAYEHWKDGTLGNGCWYNDWKQYNDRWKSTYIVSLLITALEHCRITEGTKAFSQALLDQTLMLYDWVERDFRRDKHVRIPNGLQNGDALEIDVEDHLYWVDYNKDRENCTERNGPSGGSDPHRIQELGSVSAIFVNMGMAAVNMMLYRRFGWKECKEKALRTRASIERVYDNCGVYLNDRDPNTNATMLRYYILYLLGTEYGTAHERDLLFRTADHLYQTGENTGGLYYPWWGKVYKKDEKIPFHQKGSANNVDGLMINATGVTMICGAALLERLGFLPG